MPPLRKSVSPWSVCRLHSNLIERALPPKCYLVSLQEWTTEEFQSNRWLLPFLTILQTYFLQLAVAGATSGSKVQQVRHGEAPICHSFTHDCLPHLQTCCFTYLLYLPCCLPFSHPLKPWCLPLCLFSACDRLLLKPSANFATFSNLHGRHYIYQPFTRGISSGDIFQAFSWWLWRDLFFQITFSDVTFLICFHDLLVFFIISFSGCHSCCHIKCCHKLFIFLSTHFHFLKQLAFDCNVTPPALPASENQRWAIAMHGIGPARYCWFLSIVWYGTECALIPTYYICRENFYICSKIQTQKHEKGKTV